MMQKIVVIPSGGESIEIFPPFPIQILWIAKLYLEVIDRWVPHLVGPYAVRASQRQVREDKLENPRHYIAWY
jgi:hypothetical protein